MLLANMAGAYAYSDGQPGIGYSYLTAAARNRRIQHVLVNGIPLNDPESRESGGSTIPTCSRPREPSPLPGAA